MFSATQWGGSFLFLQFQEEYYSDESNWQYFKAYSEFLNLVIEEKKRYIFSICTTAQPDTHTQTQPTALNMLNFMEKKAAW